MSVRKDNTMECRLGNAKPLHVLFVANQATIRGGEKALLSLLEALPPDRYLLACIVPGEGDLANELRRRGIRFHVCACPILSREDEWRPDPRYWAGRIRRLVWASPPILDVIRDTQWDLVFNNATWTLIAPFLAARLGTPCITYVHDHSWFSGIFQSGPPAAFGRLMNRFNDLFLSPTLTLASRLGQFAPPEKIRVVSAGVDDCNPQLDRTTLDPALKEWLELPGPVFSAVGMTDPDKGWSLLLEALTMVRNEVPQARACLIGPDTHPTGSSDLQSIIQQFGLQNCVWRTGIHPFPAAILARSYAHLITSTSEVLPFSLLEAMSVGCPTITVPCHGPESVVRDGITGLVTEERSAQSLATAMIKLAKHPEDRARMASQAKREADTAFAKNAWLVRCRQAIDEVATSAPRHCLFRRVFSNISGVWAGLIMNSPQSWVKPGCIVANSAVSRL